MSENKGLILNPEQQALISGAVQHGAVALASRMQLVEHVIGQMVEGTHYGASFPGDKKKNLLKPGADYLGVAFRLVPTFEVERIDLPGAHREYSVSCRVNGPDGSLITNGLGSCTTMESKYRYRNAKRKCPNCGQEAVIKGSEKYGGGWLCWQKQGGCNAKWIDGDATIEQQVVGKIENTDPADQYNTCLKIAKKRAMVDAMITATGCSAEFTQDVEDMQHEAPTTPAPKAAPAASTPAAAPSAAAPAAGSPAGPAPQIDLRDEPKDLTNPLKGSEPLATGDLQALAAGLNGAANKAALDFAWQQVVNVQSKLSSPDLTFLMKARRAAETRLGVK